MLRTGGKDHSFMRYWEFETEDSNGSIEIPHEPNWYVETILNEAEREGNLDTHLLRIYFPIPILSK